MANFTTLTVSDTGYLKLPNGTTNQSNLMVFNQPGTFTWTCPTGVTTVSVLVVAGGGGGGNDFGAGGGGGGVVYHPTYTVTAGNSYTVTVGNGGAKSVSNASSASNGGSSVFDSLTASGGGGGASNSTLGIAGGSGGGAAKVNRTSYGASNQGTFTGATVYGNRGGNASTDAGNGGGAGGGGAGAVGGDAAAASTNAGSIGGAGGAGIQLTIGGITAYYAGGGGGGTYIGYLPGAGGTGGGGNGSCRDTRAQDGQPGTGGGGGGAGQAQISGAGNGGSGIVIISTNSSINSTTSAGLSRINTSKGVGSVLETYDTQAGIWRGTKTTPQVESIVTRGLVLHLDAGDPLSYNPGHSGNTWSDLSGRGNHATISGSVTWDNSAGGTFMWNATTGQAVVPSTQDFAFGTNDFTWETWIEPSTVSGTYVHVMAFPSQGTSCLKINAGDGQIYYYSPSFTSYASTNGWNAAPGVWNHIIVQRLNGVLYSYINGLPVSTKAGFSNNFTAQACYIGLPSDISTETVAKRIAVVRVYTRALTPYEVKKNYDVHKERFSHTKYWLPIVTDGLIYAYDFANPTSYSGYTTYINDLSPWYNTVRNPAIQQYPQLSSYNATTYNSPTFSNTAYSDYGGGMTCVNSTFVTNTILETNFNTYCIWLKYNGINASESIILNKESVVEYKWDSAAGTLQFAVYTSNTSWFWQTTGFSNPSTGSVVHFVFTFDGNSVNTWINGFRVQSYGYSGNSVLNTGSYTKFNERGGTAAYTNSTPGNNTFYQIQFYDRALTDDEIIRNFEAGSQRFSIRN
jgi:hypothetical protein